MSDLDDLKAALEGADDAAAPITRDLRCLGCGYNLRGNMRDGACPECGAPIGKSVYGDHLRFGDPTWVGSVRLGLHLMFSAIAWGLILMIGLGLTAGATQSEGLIFVVLILLPIAANTVLCIGAFKATTPEPRLTLDEAPLTVRRALRGIIIAAGIAVPTYIIALYADAVSRRWNLSNQLEFVLRMSLLTLPAMIYGCLLYLIPLARRIPDPALVSMSRIVLVGLPATMVAEIVLPGFDLPGLVLAAVHFLAFVFSVWTLVLIWIYGAALDAPARAARRHARRRK